MTKKNINCWDIYETYTNPKKYEKIQKQIKQTKQPETITYTGKQAGWNFHPYQDLKYTWTKQGNKKILTITEITENKQ